MINEFSANLQGLAVDPQHLLQHSDRATDVDHPTGSRDPSRAKVPRRRSGSSKADLGGDSRPDAAAETDSGHAHQDGSRHEQNKVCLEFTVSVHFT